jgi:hypothetical protein
MAELLGKSDIAPEVCGKLLVEPRPHCLLKCNLIIFRGSCTLLLTLVGLQL